MSAREGGGILQRILTKSEDQAPPALTYDAPFSNIHAGGPDELFGDKANVIEGIFDKLEEVNTGVISKAS